MKNMLLTLLIILATINASAERKIFTSSKVNIDKTIDGGTITATEYKTKLTIVDYYCDTIRNQVLLLLDKLNGTAKEPISTGMYTLALFDVSRDSILWEKRFHSMHAIRHVCNNDVFIIYYPGRKSICYNKQDATELWSTNEKIILINNPYQLAICASGVALDLKTGQKKWEYPLDDRLDWSDINYPNDSSIIIINNGIYYLNLSTGKGWNNAETTWSMGGALGDWTINHLCSNALTDSNKIFWASKKTLSCYGMNGEVQWQIPLPADSISRSFIDKDDNGHIILTNSGSAFKKSMFGYGWSANNLNIIDITQPEWNWGKPYIASFNIATGERHFTIPLPDNISNIQTIQYNDTLILNSTDEVFIYNKKSGQLLINKKKKNTLLNQYTNLITHKWGKTVDGRFYHLNSLYPDEYLFQNSNDEVLRVTKNLDIIDTLGTGNTYTPIYKKNNILLLDAAGKTHVIKDHQLVNTLMLKTPIIMSNKILEIGNHYIRVADTSGLF